jgi:hypothetical protein
MNKSNLVRAIIESTSIVSLLGWVALSIAPPTVAQTPPDLSYNGAKIYKDAKNNVYFMPYPRFGTEVKYKNVQVTKSVTSDACGVAKVTFSKNSSTFPTAVSFNSNSDSIDSIAEVPKGSYKCVSGAPVWKNVAAQTGIFQIVDRSGSRILNQTIYYPASRTGGSLRLGLVGYSADIVKRFKLNDCGFAYVSSLTNSSRKTSTQLSIDDDDINVATLPLNPAPPTCIKRKLYLGSVTAPTLNSSAIYHTSKAIYVVGLAPGSLNVVKYNALKNSTEDVYDSSCGLFLLKRVDPTLTSMRIDGANRNIVMSGNSYSCWGKPYSGTPYRDRYSGRVYYIPDNSKQSTITIETPTTVNKNIPVNHCGFVAIAALNKVSGYTSGDKVSINGSSFYDVGSLPLANEDLKCIGKVAYRTPSFGVAVVPTVPTTNPPASTVPDVPDVPEEEPSE